MWLDGFSGWKKNVFLCAVLWLSFAAPNVSFMNTSYGMFFFPSPVFVLYNFVVVLFCSVFDGRAH